jgi:hypothetical protein
MSLLVSLITDRSDFDEAMPMEYDAWRTPYNPQLKHFRPDMLNRADAIARAIAKNTDKLQERKPFEFMIKVTDTETNEIIGFAIWALNELKDEGDGKTEANWYQEGSEEKEFAELFIDGLWGFIGERVTRKHMGIFMQIFVCNALIILQIYTPSLFIHLIAIVARVACWYAGVPIRLMSLESKRSLAHCHLQEVRTRRVGSGALK